MGHNSYEKFHHSVPHRSPLDWGFGQMVISPSESVIMWMVKSWLFVTLENRHESLRSINLRKPNMPPQTTEDAPILGSPPPPSPCQRPPTRAHPNPSLFFIMKLPHSLLGAESLPDASDGGCRPHCSKLPINSLCARLTPPRLFPHHRMNNEGCYKAPLWKKRQLLNICKVLENHFSVPWKPLVKSCYPHFRAEKIEKAPGD